MTEISPMFVFFSVSLAILFFFLARIIYVAYRASCLEKESGISECRSIGAVTTLRYRELDRWGPITIMSFFSAFVVVMVVAMVNAHIVEHGALDSYGFMLTGSVLIWLVAFPVILSLVPLVTTHRVSDKGILSRNLTDLARFHSWSDVDRVSYDYSTSAFVLQSRGRKILVHPSMRGIESFSRIVLERIPEERWDPSSYSMDKARTLAAKEPLSARKPG